MGQSQYVQLPDGSYGEFDAGATDEQIKSHILGDFPDAYGPTTQLRRPLRDTLAGAPGKMPVTDQRTTSERVGDRIKSNIQGPIDTMIDAVDQFTGNPKLQGQGKEMQDQIGLNETSPVKKLAKVATVGPRMAGSMVGKMASDYWKDPANAAGDAVTGLVMGGGEVPSVRAPSSARASSAEAGMGRSFPTRGAGAAAEGGAGILGDVADMVMPTMSKRVRAAGSLLRKVGGRAQGTPTEAPMPHPLAGAGAEAKGVPVDQWGQRIPTKAPVARPKPGWQGQPEPDLDMQVRGGTDTPPPTQPKDTKLTLDDWRRLPEIEKRMAGKAEAKQMLEKKGPGVGGTANAGETGGEKVQWPDNYKNTSPVLTRGGGAGANYSADELAAFKAKHKIVDTPQTTAGDTSAAVDKEVSKVEGQGQMGKSPAVGKLQKSKPQGGHAGGTVSSTEELSRPGKHFIIKKSGDLSFHGKSFAPEETPAGASHVTVNADGSYRVNAGTDLTAIQQKRLSRAHFGASSDRVVFPEGDKTPAEAKIEASSKLKKKVSDPNFELKHLDNVDDRESVVDSLESRSDLHNARLHDVELPPNQLYATDPDFQDRDLVNEYTKAMKKGAKFPPIDVIRASTGQAVVEDGHHRATAAGILKRPVRGNVIYAGTDVGHNDIMEDYEIKQNMDRHLQPAPSTKRKR